MLVADPQSLDRTEHIKKILYPNNRHKWHAHLQVLNSGCPDKRNTATWVRPLLATQNYSIYPYPIFAAASANCWRGRQVESAEPSAPVECLEKLSQRAVKTWMITSCWAFAVTIHSLCPESFDRKSPRANQTGFCQWLEYYRVICTFNACQAPDYPAGQVPKRKHTWKHHYLGDTLGTAYHQAFQYPCNAAPARQRSLATCQQNKEHVNWNGSGSSFNILCAKLRYSKFLAEIFY